MLNNHVLVWLRRSGIWLAGAATIFISFYPGMAVAADASDFSIQVSPSPLVVTLTPGQQQTATIAIRNFSSHSETLRPDLSGFNADAKTKKITLTRRPPVGMSDWVHFGQPSITLGAGSSQNLSIVFNTPKDVGFSYAAAITLTRDSSSQTQPSTTQLKGSVAVFCLININRPDAKSALQVQSFTAAHSSYEFLPARFDITIKNTGNVISQPTGTIFIQRTFDSQAPISTLPINAEGGYVLPDTLRTYTASWQSGFPVYASTAGTSGAKPSSHLSWNWSHLSQLRFGRYVAKAVLVYNDGHGDVPVIASYSFWVIPWRIMFALLVLIIVVVTGMIAWGRLVFKGVKKVKHHAHR